MDAPAGVTQEEGHTGFLHLPSAVLAFTFIARRILLMHSRQREGLRGLKKII